MSAPTPPWRPLHVPAARPPVDAPAAPTERLATVRAHVPAAEAAPPLILPARSAVGAVFDVAARVGTAVTLAALLVLTGTVLGAVEGEPTPTGASTAGR